MGDACDLLGFALGGNHTPELGCSRNQLSARRRGWQGHKAVGYRSREFGHLGIFRGALHPSAADGTAIVDRHIVEQPPSRLHVSSFGVGDGADTNQTEKYCQDGRSEEHTSELQSLMRIPYAA